MEKLEKKVARIFRWQSAHMFVNCCLVAHTRQLEFANFRLSCVIFVCRVKAAQQLYRPRAVAGPRRTVYLFVGLFIVSHVHGRIQFISWDTRQIIRLG